MVFKNLFHEQWKGCNCILIMLGHDGALYPDDIARSGTETTLLRNEMIVVHFIYLWFVCTTLTFRSPLARYMYITRIIKELLGMTSIWVFCLVWCSVFRRSRFFIIFRYLKTLFLINIYKNPEKILKHCICTHKGRLNVIIALGHMLMPPAQRWADNLLLQVNPLPSL